MRIYQLFSYIASSPFTMDQIKLKTAVDLGFPANDVCKIEHFEDRLEVELTVLGLLGVDSPLPLYMVVAGMREGNNAWRTFLNLINDYLYKLLFQCWLQVHPLAQINQQQPRYSYYLNCLAASTFEDEQSVPFNLARWFFGKRRSTGELAGMIAEYLDNVDVRVEELQPRWLDVETSSHQYLSNNAVLGTQILTTATNVDCYLHFYDWQRFVEFLYGKHAEADYLNYIIQRFLPPHFQVHIHISIDLYQNESPRLCDPQVGLGYFNLVGQPCHAQVKLAL